MFTGIIQAVGEITAREPRGGDVRVRIRTAELDLGGIGLGDSIATGGVCLTVVRLPGNGFEADVSVETLQRTALGAATAGQAVNLERSLTPASQLGGHIVSGHVDGVGSLYRRYEEARSVRMEFEAPHALAKFIAEKGSICVDGVSLTVNGVDGARFSVNIVPHTLEQTTLGGLVVGSAVNLEVDIIARYLERLMLGERAAHSTGVTEQLLAENGFVRD